MIEPDQASLDPVSFAGGILDPYRHVCAFVNSREEGYRILDPFVNEGLANGEKIMYVVDPGERANLVRHLGRLGHDMPELLGRAQCVVRTWSETYMRGGSFDPDAMMELLDEYFDVSRPPRIRMVTDMGWAVEEQDLSHLMLEYEARANIVHPKHGHVVICVYDIAKFSGDILIDVLRTHPMALVGGMLQVNPFFVPAEEFLKELRSREQ